MSTWGEPYSQSVCDGYSDARRIEGRFGTWAYIRPYRNSGLSEGVVLELCAERTAPIDILLDPHRARLMAESIIEMLEHLTPEATG